MAALSYGRPSPKFQTSAKELHSMLPKFGYILGHCRLKPNVHQTERLAESFCLTEHQCLLKWAHHCDTTWHVTLTAGAAAHSVKSHPDGINGVLFVTFYDLAICIGHCTS